MAVTLVSSPMDGHRAGVNHDQGRPRCRVKQRAGLNQSTLSKAKSPSSDYVARIARSTAELSANIKYISYVIAYSAAGPTDGDQNIKAAARRRSGKVDKIQEEEKFEVRRGSAATKSSKRTNSTKSQAESTMSRKSGKAAEPQKDLYTSNDVLYPVSRGQLRAVYVEELERRLRQENNIDEGWHLGRLGEWYWEHLKLQQSRERVGRNLVKHLDAAVQLHRRMVANPRVKKTGKISDDEDLWRDVVDQMANALFMGKAWIPHMTGGDATYEQFLAKWEDMVDKEGWNSKALELFPNPKKR